VNLVRPRDARGEQFFGEVDMLTEHIRAVS
jgi:hypothetical protein